MATAIVWMRVSITGQGIAETTKRCERPSVKPLLAPQILATGHKDIEGVASPLHGYDGVNLMPREEAHELLRHIFIEQDLQNCA